MAKWFDRLSGWAMPHAAQTDYASLARELGHRDREHDCLGRRQGLCPGVEFCHDCPWSEGTDRESDLR